MKVSLQHVFKSIRGEPLKIQLDPTKPEGKRGLSLWNELEWLTKSTSSSRLGVDRVKLEMVNGSGEERT